MASPVASELRSFGRAWVAAAALTWSGGCIYVTGVSDYEKGACEGPCDAGVDAPADAPSQCPSGMVFVAGGGFVPVGRPTGGIVRVDGLCVDPTEVTESAYRACVLRGACTAPPNKTFCNHGQSGRDADPINCVDIGQAKAFCASQGKRLPTEDEWEWVARGGPLGYAFPWGNAAPLAADDPERLCWQGKTKHDTEATWPSRPAGTCAVGAFPSGARDGLFDLAGNVWEWTSTEATGTTFVFRGGSAFDPADPTTFQAGSRRTAASAAYPGVGFRCFATAR
ncbi:MAG: SUMF1/EgtB/PvdO family nonheme iron enzyme [Deltaproteobacteria bacterium]|nr:SUMF1/EgtB/PvdO family nonheme iron enzyme [Deltaproteobacteria bacterium]